MVSVGAERIIAYVFSLVVTAKPEYSFRIRTLTAIESENVGLLCPEFLAGNIQVKDIIVVKRHAFVVMTIQPRIADIPYCVCFQIIAMQHSSVALMLAARKGNLFMFEFIMQFFTL